VRKVRSLEGVGEIKVYVEKIKDSVNMSFEDSGLGIAPELLPHIFDPYYLTSSSSGSGSGLGLSIVKNLALQNKIDVSVSSVLGKGTKFTLLIPSIVN